MCEKGRDCITVSDVNVSRSTAGALAGTSATHPSTAPCSCRCCWCEMPFKHKLDMTGQRPPALF
ncbi:hypothetical protein EK904_006395, partial [Melospiza melodia maxima]